MRIVQLEQLKKAKVRYGLNVTAGGISGCGITTTTGNKYGSSKGMSKGSKYGGGDGKTVRTGRSYYCMGICGNIWESV